MNNILFVVKNLEFFRPIGLMQISAIAEQNTYQPHLAVLSRDDIFEKIEKINPEVVAYSSTTGDFKQYAAVNKKIKSRYPHLFTLMGGPHPTFFPDSLEEADLNALCIGEGENSFKDLLQNLSEGKDYSNIENIVTKNNHSPKLNFLIQDLDNLPFPDRKLFYGNDKPKIVNFMASRGCSFSCTYCFNHAFKKKYPGQKYTRRHSVDYVIDEISEARKFLGFDFVKFVDDVFVFAEDYWFDEFADKYPKKIGLPFYVYTRFNLITSQITKKLKKAGCVTIGMSIESSNQSIRENVLKRKMTNEEIIRGAGYCKENGLGLTTGIITGIPGSNINDDIYSIDLCIKADISVPEFFVYQPYPGTELGDKCIKEGSFDGDLSKVSSYAFTKRSLLNCFNEKDKDIQLNIGLLGPIAARYPKLKDIIINYLIYLPPNKVFEKLYAIEKMFVYPSKVYKMNYTLMQRIDILKNGLKLEKEKRED